MATSREAVSLDRAGLRDLKSRDTISFGSAHICMYIHRDSLDSR